MKQLLLVLFIAILSLSSRGQDIFGMCVPVIDIGTDEGDYIASVDYNGVNYMASFEGDAYIISTINVMNITIGTTGYIDVTNGSVGGQDFDLWVDLNSDGVFQDDEWLSSATNINADAAATLTMTIPYGLQPRCVAGRIRMHWSNGETAACGDITWGQVFDFPVSLNSDPQWYCQPLFDSGPLDEDFIAQFTGMSTQYYGSQISAVYELADLYENALVGSTVSFSVIAGEYGDDYFYLWVDHENDGFETDDLVDSYDAEIAGEEFVLQYDIAADAFSGSRRARLACRYTENEDPCNSGTYYGHTVDFYIVYTNNDADPYCDPYSEYGTTDGDYIAEFYINLSGAGSSQSNPSVYYNDFSGDGNFPFYALAGADVSASLTSGTWGGSENYKGWLDYNQNNVFEDSEHIFEVSTSGAGETVDLYWSNPMITNENGTGMRIMSLFDDVLDDPCDIGDFGEVEDYLAILVKSNNGYCDPYFGYGNFDGDFINGFQLQGVNLADIGAYSISYYKDYTTMIAPVEVGGTYTVTVQAGAYSEEDYYKLWVDWNEDGEFNNATEAVADAQANVTAFEFLQFTLNVPANATLGNKRMRLVCLYNQDPEPCHVGANYGEYLEITLSVEQEVAVVEWNSSEIELYPNPSSENLILSIGDFDTQLEATITDATGRVVDMFTVQGYRQWNHNYAPGYYSLTLTDGQNMVNRKFVVE